VEWKGPSEKNILECGDETRDLSTEFMSIYNHDDDNYDCDDDNDDIIVC